MIWVELASQVLYKLYKHLSYIHERLEFSFYRVSEL